MKLRRAFLPAAAALATALALAALAVRDDSASPEPAPAATVPAGADTVARGAYLARLGNCIGCHTVQGGAPLAGGRAIETPFGAVFSGNLTPDDETGLGRWSADDFWQAMHHGRSRDGRALWPAFPYTEFTRVRREDSDALFAYLRAQAPVRQAQRPAALRFPFNLQLSLAAWRWLYFRPGALPAAPTRPGDWQRGAYLVEGLGHCAACHSPRDALGGVAAAERLSGGTVHGWWAPSLRGGAAADAEAFVALMRSGVNAQGAAMGPMAEVVFHSGQHLAPDDLRAMAAYLRDTGAPALPARPALPPIAAAETRPGAGARLYERHCAECHGAQGEGRPPGLPPLRDNPSVALASPGNVVRAILQGGYAPATADQPRPYGMPPFGHELSDAEIADIASHVRQRFGGVAAPVSELEVFRAR